MIGTDERKLGALRILSTEAASTVKAITPDGGEIHLRVDPITAISTGASIIGGALQSGQNYKVDQALEQIENRLDQIQASLLLIIDLLQHMGAVIREAERENTIEFIKTNLLAQIDVFIHKLPELTQNPSTAASVAKQLLNNFETPAAQIRRYGCMTSDTSAVAMLHLYALYHYANEYKPNRKAAFQQYKSYFLTLLDASADGSLARLLSDNQQQAADAKSAVEGKPREYMYSHYSTLGDIEMCEGEVWLVFTGDINAGYDGHRENRNEHCHHIGPHGPKIDSAVPGSLFWHSHPEKIHLLDGDAGWERRKDDEVAERNRLRGVFQACTVNVAILQTLIATARKAADTAQRFIDQF